MFIFSDLGKSTYFLNINVLLFNLYFFLHKTLFPFVPDLCSSQYLCTLLPAKGERAENFVFGGTEGGTPARRGPIPRPYGYGVQGKVYARVSFLFISFSYL